MMRKWYKNYTNTYFLLDALFFTNTSLKLSPIHPGKFLMCYNEELPSNLQAILSFGVCFPWQIYFKKYLLILICMCQELLWFFGRSVTFLCPFIGCLQTRQSGTLGCCLPLVAPSESWGTRK